MPAPQPDELDQARALAAHLDASPTTWHNVLNCAARLDAAGFTRIDEREPWVGKLKRGDKAYFTRDGSTLVAFVVGGAFEAGNGFRAVGAHTDSPVLKVKPVSSRTAQGYVQVGVECYGGGLWHTWLDRDLGIAGRVVVRTGEGEYEQRLVHINRPILRVPTLCIHLQSSKERAALELNKETHLVPILGMLSSQLNDAVEGEALDKRHAPALLRVLSAELGVQAADIVDMELTLCDTQPAQLGGASSELLFGPRLDNQMHCFTSTAALVRWAGAHNDAERAVDPGVAMIALFDHEEVGSRSAQGAHSQLFRDAIVRITRCFVPAGSVGGEELFTVGLTRSLLLSVDGSHAVHPNYASKHETEHRPVLNGGTVIKTNVNQRYATNAVTGFWIRELARRTSTTVQEFVVRQDCPCGSTIGPIIAANTGIRTVDIGMPQLSMHSIRETCGVIDIRTNTQLLYGLFQIGRQVDEAIRRI